MKLFEAYMVYAFCVFAQFAVYTKVSDVFMAFFTFETPSEMKLNYRSILLPTRRGCGVCRVCAVNDMFVLFYR